MKKTLVGILLVTTVLVAACHKSSSSGSGEDDTGTDTDADSDTDPDSSTDTDTDADSDTDTDSDCDQASAPEYTWCDEATGLLWEDPHMDAPAGIHWITAEGHCDDLAELPLGSFDDWRLPSIEELRTLIRDCPATEPEGDCAVAESCLEADCADAACDGCASLEGPHENGCYWDPTLEGICEIPLFWSSSPVEDLTDHHWGINFGTAAVLATPDDITDEPDTDTETVPEWTPVSNVRCVSGSL